MSTSEGPYGLCDYGVGCVGIIAANDDEIARCLAGDVGDEVMQDNAKLLSLSWEMAIALRGFLTYIEDGNVMELRPCGFNQELRDLVSRLPN